MTNEEMENVVVLISVVCLKSLHIVLNDIHEWKDREADREEEWPGDKGAGGGVWILKEIPRTAYKQKHQLYKYAKRSDKNTRGDEPTVFRNAHFSPSQLEPVTISI